MSKTIKIEYPPLVESTFNEGPFKTSLKKLNPILDHLEDCTKIRDFIIAELKSSFTKSVLAGINDSLALFKIAFEFGIPKGKNAVISTEADAASTKPLDHFFQHVLEPILPEILSYWNHHILAYCHLGAEELVDVADSPATSSHQLICLIHKAVRIFLSLFKRIMDSGEDYISVRYHLQEVESSLEGLLNRTKIDLPLDVKCNLGLGICYILKIRNPEYLRTQLDKVFSPASFIGNDPVNQLAFAFGLLNVSSTSVMEDKAFECRMLQIARFLFTLDHGSKEALNLGTARVLELWMEKLVQSGIVPSCSGTPDIVALFPDIEFFVFSYLPGHIDAVKSCCRNILRNLTRIYDRMESPDVWTEIKVLIERILVKPEHVKWIALWCVTGTTRKSLVILDIDPKASETLLSSERTMKNPASEVYLTLMTHHIAEVSLEKWERTWIEPLFSTQKQISPNESNWPQKRSIISSILKTGETKIIELLLDFVLRKMNNASSKLESCCTESSLLAVEAIKLATELNVEMKTIVSSDSEKAEEYFRGLVPREILHSWATSSRIQIRLACFSLLVETKKSTEVISQSDFESIKLLFKYNIVSQNAAFRQQFFAYYKKLMKRLRDSMNLLIRNQDLGNLENYDKFFEWLWNFLTKEEGLFPGANFGRRCQSLEFISILLEKFDVTTLKIALPSNEDLSYLRWIFDTYEYNKKLVFPILLKLYSRPLQEENLGSKLLEASFQLCESVHPPDSVTGRYLALFLVQHRNNGIPWIGVPELLTKVVEKLNIMLESVRKLSLIEVASKTQMYGYFRLIRTLFTEDSSISGCQDWSIYLTLTHQILKLCYDFNQVLLPVLGDAAPEGFLPGLPDSEPGNSQVVRSINAQRLLVCSWRSMRDICMLLSEMVTVFSIEGEKAEFVFTLDEVQGIGDHLLFLLKNVMHRGVFEQVFTGFKHLAYRLFRSNSGKLNELPVKWLNDSFDQELITTKCITRRSAGLPFIFQALLSPMCLNEPFISKYVDRLFEQYAAADTDSGSYVRIHCTNVLRGLFKDANFSRVIMPYVPKGLKLVFDELKSPNWNECNAGLMLFGAIIRRTFGPELNLMTAPTFFRRFPEMYEFLLEQVRKCAQTVIENVTHVKYQAADDFTYQVLLLLSSFAVTGVVEYGPLKISEFIPPIHTCGLSSDYQVREVAAKALNPFLIKSSVKVEFILSILKEYEERPLQKGANAIHGDLLQVLHVLKSIKEEEHKKTVIEAFKKTFGNNDLIWTCPCPTVYESMAEICIHLGQEVKTVHSNFQSFYALTFDPLRLTDKIVSFPGLANADAVLAEAQITFALYEPNPQGLVYDWLNTKSREFLLPVLKVLSSRKFLSAFPNSSEPESMLPEMVVIFDAALKRYMAEEFEYSAQTAEEEGFLEFLAGADGSIYGAWAEIPENLCLCESLFSKVLEICETEVGTMTCKESAIIILEKIAFHSQFELNAIQTEALCKILSTLCDSGADLDLRFAVAKSMPSMPFIKIQNFTVLEQCKFWYTVLTLMLDDDGTVRNEIYAKLGVEPELIALEGGSGRCQFCERKSCELIVNSFLTQFAQQNTIEALVVIVGLILRDDYEIPVTGSPEQDCEEEHLFERSEMNAYAEPLLLAKILYENLLSLSSLHGTLRQNFQNTVLTPDLLDLYKFVSNMTIAIPDSDSLTLQTLASCTLPQPPTDFPQGHNSLSTLGEKGEVQLYIYEFLSSFLSR